MHIYANIGREGRREGGREGGLGGREEKQGGRESREYVSMKFICIICTSHFVDAD